MGLSKEKVILEDYTDEWHQMFMKEKEKLNALIGQYVLQIEHVGSTSIPGLMAKPIIDIMVVVKKLDDAPKFFAVLTQNGYDIRLDNGDKGEYLVRVGPEENRTHYIHIIEKNSVRWNNFILFKDYLLRHPQYIDEYNTLKQELALKYANDRKRYTAGKNEFISKIIALSKGYN